MAGPWERYGGTGAPPPAAGPVTIGTPRPQRVSPAEQQRLDLARRADARAQADFERRQQQPPAAQQTAQQNRAAVQSANLDALVNQINRAQELYESGLQGAGPGSLLQWLPDAISPTNARFNSAAAGVGEIGLAAFRVPGVGSQSDAELRQFIAANTPRASDNDAAIEEKLNNLRNRVNEVREALGLPPAPWRGAPQRDPAATGGTLMRGDQAPDEPVNPLTPEQAERYDAILRGNPQATSDQLAQQLQAAGLPVPRNLADIVRARDTGAGFQPGSAGQFAPPDISDVRGQGGAGETIDAFGRGAADLPTIGLADELSAMGDTLFSGGTYRENLHRQRAIDSFDQEHHPYARFGGQLGGALLIPSRAPAAFASGGVRAGARQLGIEGATLGGLYGFGATDGSLLDRTAGAVTGAAIGGPTGYATGRTLGSLMTPRTADMLPPRRAEAVRAINDAEGLGINLNPWDVGGAGVRRTTAIIAQDPFGAGPIAAGNQRVLGEAAAARDDIAGRVGTALEPVGGGEAALAGASAYRRTSGAQGRGLYERARRLSEGAQVRPNALNATIQAHIEAEQQVLGGSPAMALLRNLQDDIARRNLVTVDGVRGLRSNLRSQLVDAGMTPDNADRIVGDLVGAASADLQASLSPEAMAAFQQADQFWAQRLDTIRNTLQPIIGRRSERSGEDVARALRNNAQGNGTRLGRFIQALPQEEASTVRATLIGQLGRARSGNQSAEGGAFSLDEFLTNWDQIRGSREMIFDRETANSLSQLARVAERVKAAGRYSNRSNTGSAVMGATLAAHAIYSPLTVAFQALGTYSAGRLLSSPRVARWLARMPRDGRAAPGYIGRLAQIARAEPAIAADVLGLQQRLQSAFAQSPTRAAAEEEVDRR